MKMTRVRLTMLVVATVMAATLALAACGGSSADTADTTGTTADADIEIIAPADFSVSDYAGKPLVVNVFGSWCPPCNSEAPALAEFAGANPDTQFVGVAVNDQEGDAVGFMNEYGLTYPLVIDDNRLAGEFGVTGVPTTIFFDAQGQEKDRIVGAASLDQFEAALATAK